MYCKYFNTFERGLISRGYIWGIYMAMDIHGNGGNGVVMAAMTEANTTLSGTSLKLVFNPTKRQFKWNGDLTSLKDFWITSLEGGNINSLLNVSSNGYTEVLKF